MPGGRYLGSLGERIEGMDADNPARLCHAVLDANVWCSALLCTKIYIKRLYNSVVMSILSLIISNVEVVARLQDALA